MKTFAHMGEPMQNNDPAHRDDRKESHSATERWHMTRCSDCGSPLRMAWNWTLVACWACGILNEPNWAKGAK
jgi:hypothetical protein